MKFRTLCLVGACVPALAAAQSSVNLFGVVDIGLSRYSTQGGASVTKVISGGLQASRIGLRGTEDLGDGLRAGFWLEGDINADNGTGGTTNANNQATGTATAVPGGQGLTFGRRSTVSLAGNWGEVRLGRDYVPTFWNFAAFDPFMMFGVASASNLFFAGTSGPSISTVRNSNSIGYLYNSASPIGGNGWYGQVQYALGENSSNAANPDDGRYLGFRGGYSRAGWNVAVASSKTRMLANGDFRTSNAGVSWESRFATLMAQYTVSNSGIAGTKYQTYLLGATIPVGLGYIPVSLMKTERNNVAGASGRQFAVGYVHNLSKRTALYATYARMQNSNGAAFTVGGSAPVPGLPNATSSGVDFGVRHSF
ncbi:MAG: porin [Ramlibacter sp.]|nr:porin [Ramlibacter sp.]